MPRVYDATAKISWFLGGSPSNAKEAARAAPINVLLSYVVSIVDGSALAESNYFLREALMEGGVYFYH